MTTTSPRTGLVDLEDHGAFARRHVATTDRERAALLHAVDAADMDAFLARVVPESIRSHDPLALPAGRTESEVLAAARRYADRNEVFTSLIGMGYHGTIVPPVLLRNILENPAWYTAYTPYQPEISQGRLEALLNFQTMVADLSGLEVANASLLDEGTAAAEAMTLARRASKHAGHTFFVDNHCHPQTIAVVRTRAEPLGIDVVVGDPASFDPECFGALVQYPGTYGALCDLATIAARVHDAGALLAVSADPLALVLLEAPGHLGADIVVGSTQRFGVPMGFGGPHAAYLATREAYARSLPGRLVGVSTDTAGRPALRLALQTREQHIRREKATSNICTAQVLLAVMAGMYAVWHGPDGLRRIAERVHRLTSVLARALDDAGFERVNDSWFDTVTVRVSDSTSVAARARAARINVRVVDDHTVGVALDETTTVPVLVDVLSAFGIDTDRDALYALDERATDGIPSEQRRTSDVLTHPVFHRYHAEHEMLRYLRRLADRDLALDRTMIPLGSCTMKLNATAEMIPITWPGFAELHPFAPDEQTAGYRSMIGDLETALLACTGYDAVSLQPNAGSQGELAGLLAIRAYHRSRGDGGRTVCLIPSSAHGTNAASAVMAGMRVVVVACDADGNVDVDDLRARATEHGDRLAALMVTYPSTHGVFEPRIAEVCAIVHDHGGQVYVDGANLNALVGLAAPGRFGADVSHLNLHKTFCIPHGGGGPGVGPVVARAHLAPFLPSHPLHDGGVGPVSSAPWGSAGILVISWAYIALMGAEGLRDATANAILNANYIARRLHEHFPVLYRGVHGDVAHECILDLRPITKATGVTVDDVAKRLIDYGFHAPTMSFPVAGTLMVEPTESESKYELDRFCDAMIAIRAEIDRVGRGDWPADDNPLHNAPHTAEDLAGAWLHPYTREEAVFPTPLLRAQKYFPPVSRIDSAYGDRHLVCSCPPVSDPVWSETHT